MSNTPKPWIVQVEWRRGGWSFENPTRFSTAEKAISALLKQEPWLRPTHWRVIYWPANPLKNARPEVRFGEVVFECKILGRSAPDEVIDLPQ